MFYSQVIKPPKKKTPHGTRYLNKYTECINKKTGKKELELTGQTNVYEIIQADAESTKIENILHAVAMGDLTALQARETIYADSTTMPNDLRSVNDLVIRAKDEFYELPLEVRKQFNNNPDEYISLMGTKEYLEIMAPYNEKLAAIAEENSHKEYLKKVKEGAKLKIDIEKEMAAMKGGSEE